MSKINHFYGMTRSNNCQPILESEKPMLVVQETLTRRKAASLLEVMPRTACDDIPARYLYSNSTRITRIVIEPDIGWAASFICTKKKLRE
ncbi:hypothetical protein KIN20_031075 [Parelaphostrongylus tenuis]|uniref:Uncharacterized protein n=1 Tax=Parelaphostrongylus tenuis TaxID=148309 RepID=A0AAD5R4T9_PARTN|nr:hypothetical protein KIN20_031075 [Parelaphostrongylus tenuis]